MVEWRFVTLRCPVCGVCRNVKSKLKHRNPRRKCPNGCKALHSDALPQRMQVIASTESAGAREHGTDLPASAPSHGRNGSLAPAPSDDELKRFAELPGVRMVAGRVRGRGS